MWTLYVGFLVSLSLLVAGVLMYAVAVLLS
jgi:hypothetical protein